MIDYILPVSTIDRTDGVPTVCGSAHSRREQRRCVGDQRETLLYRKDKGDRKQ